MGSDETIQPSNEHSGLSHLGEGATQPSRSLETFPNRNPDRDYLVELTTDEFSCVCPMTGQPDFANITIRYVPDQKIVESKSLKLYFWSFRNEGIFHEHVSNVILDDLVEALAPRWCQVDAEFSVRGGIAIRIKAEHGTYPAQLSS
jgi:7-cyano-7-deazaguanine reductase